VPEVVAGVGGLFGQSTMSLSLIYFLGSIAFYSKIKELREK
jgi:hypothetical protein